MVTSAACGGSRRCGIALSATAQQLDAMYDAFGISSSAITSRGRCLGSDTANPLALTIIRTAHSHLITEFHFVI
jgi:hypothetical protein